MVLISGFIYRYVFKCYILWYSQYDPNVWRLNHYQSITIAIVSPFVPMKWSLSIPAIYLSVYLYNHNMYIYTHYSYRYTCWGMYNIYIYICIYNYTTIHICIISTSIGYIDLYHTYMYIYYYISISIIYIYIHACWVAHFYWPMTTSLGEAAADVSPFATPQDQVLLVPSGEKRTPGDTDNNSDNNSK